MNLATAKREYRELPLQLIDEPELAARSSMDDHALDELGADIRRKGLLQPMIVARKADRYEVVAGHRRWHGCRRAGLDVVPCIVYETRDAALEGIKYSENRFREELSAADEAVLFDELLKRDCGGDVDKLCEQIGEKRAYVEGRLLLFQGDQQVFEALQQGKINIGVAHQLNQCTDEATRRSFLVAAITGGATVAAVSSWIYQWRTIAHSSMQTAVVPPAADGGTAIPTSNPLQCEVCDSDEHPHLIRYIPVHDYCNRAILQKLLAAYKAPSEPSPVAGDPRRT